MILRGPLQPLTSINWQEKLHKHLESLKGEKQSREALTISEGRRIDGVQVSALS